MSGLTHNELIVLFLSISIMLIFSRVVAELGKRIKMPVVMGEILVGVLLGPTVLGLISPGTITYLFPVEGSVSVAMHGITSLSIVMLLFVAGMEVQLPVVLQQGKSAVYISIASLLIPFSSGFILSWLAPHLFDDIVETNRLLFSVFLGISIAISALPIVVRVLMDMNLFKTRIGMLIIAAAMFNDLVGWLVFSLLLGTVGKQGTSSTFEYTLIYIIGFGLFMLTIGRRLIDRFLPWVQAKFSWPGGVLSISLGLCFLSAATTEYIGVHAILGAFVMGIAFGDSAHLHERTREIIHQFVTNIFAPLFFVSIGLNVNFIQNFDIMLVLIFLVLAFVTKTGGAALGARIAGLSVRESMAIGTGLLSGGAMVIVLGTLALDAGLITDRIFVALVVMALATSLSSPALLKKFVD